MHRQLAGVLGFLFTNAFLTKRYFQKSFALRHYNFKLDLATQMAKFDESKRRIRQINNDAMLIPTKETVHLPKLLKENQWYQEN